MLLSQMQTCLLTSFVLKCLQAELHLCWESCDSHWLDLEAGLHLYSGESCSRCLPASPTADDLDVLPVKRPAAEKPLLVCNNFGRALNIWHLQMPLFRPTGGFTDRQPFSSRMSCMRQGSELNGRARQLYT